MPHAAEDNACTRFKAEIREERAERIGTTEQARRRIEADLRELEEAQQPARERSGPASAG